MTVLKGINKEKKKFLNYYYLFNFLFLFFKFFNFLIFNVKKYYLIIIYIKITETEMLKISKLNEFSTFKKRATALKKFMAYNNITRDTLISFLKENKYYLNPKIRLTTSY